MVEETIIENNDRKRQIHKLEISEIPCFRCGTCCSKFQPQISLSEAHIIADKLGVSWRHFLADYIDPRWPGTRNFLLRHINGACVFLRVSSDQKQKLCSIHTFKPSCCQEWKPGIDRSECLDGLKTIWDLATGFLRKNLRYLEKDRSLRAFCSISEKPSLNQSFSPLKEILKIKISYQQLAFSI